ncbi:SHOCT domain-containing protein [Actinomyces radicidentis]|uniref:SHOCT domain-containing protein n=1 Tax=Actinomyces radicidentis TaxID=111015 RepID=UPI0028EAFC41|nr:SHOCT domain-containing protein [Actinomyces radicidentis]
MTVRADPTPDPRRATIQPVLQFKSHIEEKNADVAIYPDRVEWSRKGLNTVVVLTTSGGDLAMRVAHSDADQVIRTIQAAQRGELVAPAEDVVTEQTYGSAPAAGYGYVPPVEEPPAAGGEDVMAQLERLGALHSSGILTDEEFAAKKADLLSRM